MNPKSLVTTTDKAGQFTIPNVVVQGVASGATSDSSTTFSSPIPIFIDTSTATNTSSLTGKAAKFLSATLSISPQAQIVNDTQTGGSAQTNNAAVFVDGFTASTGTIQIPEADTQITGTLVNGSTGQPIASASVNLDFISYTPDQSPSGAVSVVYSAPLAAPVVTAADGSFQFLNAPAASCVGIGVSGLKLDDASFGAGCKGTVAATHKSAGEFVFTTTAETLAALQNVTSSPSGTTGDTIPPFVASVSQVTVQSASPGLLQTGVDGTNGIAINFSETVNVASNPQVVVIDEKGPNQVVVPSTAAFANNILTVTTSSKLTPGDTILVEMLAQDVTDLAGNDLVPGTAVGYASSGFPTSGFVDLTLEAAPTIITGLKPVTSLTQVGVPYPDLSAYVNSTADPWFASSTAFLDTVSDAIDGSSLFPVVYSALNTEPVASAAALSQLGTALTAKNNPTYAAQASIDENTARIQFTPSGAVDYVIVVTDSNGISKAVGILPISNVDPTKTTSTILGSPYGDGTTAYSVIAPKAENMMIDIAITGVEPNFNVGIVPRGTGGVVSGDSSSEASKILKDIVPPTAVVQLEMKALAATAGAAAGGGTGEGGGVVVASSANAIGNIPIFPVTPQALNISPANSFSVDNLEGSSELGGLSAGSTSFPNLGQTETVYDATGFSKFKPTAQLGIAISEPLGEAKVQPQQIAVGTATLTGPLPVMDAVVNDGTQKTTQNLIAYTVSSVYDLETAGRGNKTDIDLTGIVDTQGNKADAPANAKLQVRDFLPPIMTKAEYDGTDIVLTFHEGVNPTPKGGDAHINFESCGGGENFSLDLKSAFDSTVNTSDVIATLSSDKTQIDIPAGNSEFQRLVSTVPGGINGCLNSFSYAESTIYSSGTTAVGHGLVNWSDLPDLADNSDIGLADGNTWNSWSNAGLGITDLNFAMANTVGKFKVASQLSCPDGFKAGNKSYTCTVGFSQPILFGGVSAGQLDEDGYDADLNGDGKLSADELNKYCQVKFAHTSAPTNGTVTVLSTPASCNLVTVNSDGSFTLVLPPATGANANIFSPALLLKAVGFELNFSDTVAVQAKELVRFQPGHGGGHGNVSGAASVSGVFEAGSLAISNYGSSTTNVDTVGVVVEDDGKLSQTAVELEPAVAN